MLRSLHEQGPFQSVHCGDLFHNNFFFIVIYLCVLMNPNPAYYYPCLYLCTIFSAQNINK